MAPHIEVKPIYPHEEAAVKAALVESPPHLCVFALFGLALPVGYEMPPAPGMDADPEQWKVFATAVAREVSSKRVHTMPQIEGAVYEARMGKSQEDFEKEQLASQLRQLDWLIESGAITEEDKRTMVRTFMTSSTGQVLGDA